MTASTHRRFTRWLAGLASLAVVAAAAAKPGRWIQGHYAGLSPDPVAVSPAELWQRANEAAAAFPGAFVLAGAGDSMQPLYAPGTVLVVARRPFAQLEPGQTVLYRNRANRLVAHLLLARTRDGWRARGLNNRWQDMEPVVEHNLAGIVVAAFSPSTDLRAAPARAARASAFFSAP